MMSSSGVKLGEMSEWRLVEGGWSLVIMEDPHGVRLSGSEVNCGDTTAVNDDGRQ